MKETGKLLTIILIIVSIIVSIIIPIVINVIPKDVPLAIDINKMKTDFEKNKKQAIKEEREKTIKELQDAQLKENLLEKTVIEEFSKTFTEYYGEDNKNFKTSVSPDKNLWHFNFGLDEYEEIYTVNDTGKDGKFNGYFLDHSFEVYEDGAKVKQSATIKVVRDKKDKFNIYENKLLIKYLNGILGRELTDKDKNAINVKVNLNFAELEDIEDLSVYIYNKDALKIGDMIIKTKNSDNTEKQRAYVEFKIDCDRELKLDKSKLDNKNNKDEKQNEEQDENAPEEQKIEEE